MSWLFSQALVAEYSEATSSAGAPSAQLSVMPTQHKFWRHDKTMEPSKLSQFGLTCAVLTEDHGEALLTWFRADSRVRTYHLPGMALASMAPGQAYGVRWRESSARYDLKSSSWKTHLCLWEEDLPWSSVTLPKWGMTLNGALFQHPTLTRPISASASGLWPTITVCGNHNQPGSSKNAGWGLSSAVKQWPTPTKSDGSGGPGHQGRKGGLNLRTAVDGQLNPEWVEWLMNWPIGWTSLEPLSNEEFKFWQETGATHLRGEGVRDMWYANDPSETPQGSGSNEQCIGKYSDPMPGMPQICARSRRGLGPGVSQDRNMRNMPDGIQAEDVQAINSLRECRVPKRKGEAISRITMGVKFRSDRIKALGNGQVPRVAAAAFTILSIDD